MNAASVSIKTFQKHLENRTNPTHLNSCYLFC